MHPDSSIFLQIPLFQGFSGAEIEQFFAAFPPVIRRYQKGESILLAGYEIHDIGILLSGRAQAVKELYSGTAFVVAELEKGAVIGDVLSGGHTKSPVTVEALNSCKAIFFPYPLLAQGQTALYPVLHRFFVNLVAVISDKYFLLNKRVDMLLCKTLRQKIAFYLLEKHTEMQSNSFILPYTRFAWAHYLGCERSALSRELSRMAKDGLIAVQAKQIDLLSVPRLVALLHS